jgi:acyl-coenzyme A synthetase/AMP-(fatty) acid ligase
MISHCRSLTAACGYTEGEVMICVVDFKRESGLWHAIQSAILNGMHIIFIPYALMKIQPAAWMHMVTKFRGEHFNKGSFICSIFFTSFRVISQVESLIK